MPKTTFAFTNFTAGELSPRLDGRTDLDKYFSGCKTLENMVIHPHGGASRRPGTVFTNEVKTSSAKTRLIPFEFSTTQTYILEFGNQYVRFYKDNGIITEAGKTISAITKASPGVVTASSHGYSNGDYVILSGIVGMTELNGRQFKVAGVTTNTFNLTDMEGNNFDTSSLTTYASAGTAYKIYEIASPYATAHLFDIKFAQSADLMYLVHPSYAIRSLTRTGHTSWTMATPSISGSPSPNLNTTTDKYPSSVTFFEQRLVFAGSNDNPQTLWFSKASDYTNMTTGTDDTDAMIYTIASNQVNAIRYLSAQQELLIGTVGGEFVATSGSVNEPITPTNVQITKQTNYGSANIDAVQIANVTLFMQRAKRKLRELVYSYDVDGYVAPDMTILAEHMTEGGITQLAYQQEPDSILWATRDDGALLGLTYQRTEGVVGWHRHIVGGYYNTGKTIVRLFKSFTSNSTNVSVASNTITISSHGFSTGDPVYYYTASNAIGGLTTDLLYYAIATDSNTLKLATTSANATAGTAVDLTSAPSSDTTQYIFEGVNIATDVVYSASHGLSTGDTFYFSSGGSALSGLTDGAKYYVKRIDDNQFKIATSKDLDVFANLQYSSTGSTQTDKILQDAKVESISVIPADDGEYQLWMIVNRYVDGSTRRYVEYLNNFNFGDTQDDAFFLDSGLTYDSVPTTTISGLDHLEGETISILADGASHANKTVSGGSVTLDRSAQKVHAGLNYDSILQTLRIEAGSAQGVAQSKVKRVNEITVRLHKSLGIEVGGSLDDMEVLPFRSSAELMGLPVALFTGDKKVEFRDDYNTDGYVYVRQQLPLPLTVLAIYPEVTTYEG